MRPVPRAAVYYHFMYMRSMSWPLLITMHPKKHSRPVLQPAMSHNNIIFDMTNPCFDGSRVTSKVAPSKYMSHIGYQLEDYETIQELQESQQRFYHCLFRDKWRRCRWCWTWGMEVIQYNFSQITLHRDNVTSIQYNFSRDCFLCEPCSELEEPSWYGHARQQCTRALTDGAIMPHAIPVDVLQIISTFMIGYYVDMKRRGTHDNGYNYST